MSNRHIPFWELESEEAADPSHLAACEQCRREWEIFRFIRAQARSAPQMETPPFFASRIAHTVQPSKPSFTVLLERAARQLIPLFVTLILLSSSFLFFALGPNGGEFSAETVFEQPPEVQVSLEYVVDSLRQPQEEPRIEEP